MLNYMSITGSPTKVIFVDTEDSNLYLEIDCMLKEDPKESAKLKYLVANI